MWGQIHNLRHMTYRESQTSAETGRVHRDSVHPALERVLVIRRAHYFLRETRVVLEQDVEPLLLAGEQPGIQQTEIISSDLRVLDRMNDETVLEPNRVVRVAFATLERIFAGFRQDPKVRDARARMLCTLRTHPAVLSNRHLPGGPS